MRKAKAPAPRRLSATKAREILHDGTVHGHRLTKRQRGFFGAVSEGSAMKSLNAARKT